MKLFFCFIFCTYSLSCLTGRKSYAKQDTGNNKQVLSTIHYRFKEGYFLFYRPTPEITDSDVTYSKEMYHIFYFKHNSINVEAFSHFSDTLLLDTTNYIAISPLFGAFRYWAPLKEEENFVLTNIEPKYSVSSLRDFSVYPLLKNSIPPELINSPKAFIAFFQGKLLVTQNNFSCEHSFSNLNRMNFGTKKTCLVFPSDGNKITYQLSIQLKE
jgi:hypothetical protein